MEAGPGLENEYVLIENQGLGDQEMTNWTLSDENDHTYLFLAGYTLRAGQAITLWTKSGISTGTDLYWGRDNGVWGQNDTAYLRNKAGTVIHSLEWSSSE
ncbi:MAG: lamin tail domain-containing protein [Chloroflexi bacterium]|nr:lamin tail domain-containing protein [Chloroflexota bacterium]